MDLRRLAVLAITCALCATEPNQATRRWWAHITALANDGLQGRDTGSPGYRKAAAYVVAQFERNGLKPAGEHGFYQTVPLHVLRFRADRSTVELVGAGGSRKLQWLRQITVPARPGMPESLDAALVFAGSGEAPEGIDPHGKIMVELGASRSGTGGRAGRAGNGRGGNGRSVAAGTLSIDTMGGPEPPRWPVQYAVQMTLADGAPANGGRPAPVALRFNPEFADILFEGTGHTYKELLASIPTQNKSPNTNNVFRAR